MVIGANSGVSGATNVTQPDVQRPHQGHSRAAVEDRTRFTGVEEQAQKLSARLKTLPESRAERVEQVRKAIAEGTHKVSNEQIAGAVIEEYSQ